MCLLACSQSCVARKPTSSLTFTINESLKRQMKSLLSMVLELAATVHMLGGQPLGNKEDGSASHGIETYD